MKNNASKCSQLWHLTMAGSHAVVTVSFFSSPTQEVLLHQDGLKQMVINNHVLRREIVRQKEVSGLGKSQHSKAEPTTPSPCPL